MKIVYVIDSLAFKGGAERIISEKMNYLSTVYGYGVSVITCYQFPQTNPNSYYLSDQVRQIDLCIPVYSQYKYKYPIRLWMKWKYNYELCCKLGKTVKSIDPDILIGVSYTLADVVCRIKCRAAKIIESHEARLFTMSGIQYWLNSAFPPFFYKLYRMMYLHTIEKRADVVVTLTQKNAFEWRKARRIEIIPNFSSMPITKLSHCENKKVIAVGRYDWQKGYDRLVDIWKLVSVMHPDWQLDIYGEGELKPILEDSIRNAKLTNIALHDFMSDISSKYSESSICVLTSRYEGFSLVLLEALRHGVPCVSFNCPFGPEDVVEDGKCGYIVEDGNIELFAERLGFLMDNVDIRKSFSKEAIERAKIFNKESIMQQWKALFETLIS